MVSGIVGVIVYAALRAKSQQSRAISGGIFIALGAVMVLSGLSNTLVAVAGIVMLMSGIAMLVKK